MATPERVYVLAPTYDQPDRGVIGHAVAPYGVTQTFDGKLHYDPIAARQELKAAAGTCTTCGDRNCMRREHYQSNDTSIPLTLVSRNSAKRIKTGCPIGNDIPELHRAIVNGGDADILSVLRSKTIMASLICSTCPQARGNRLCEDEETGCEKGVSGLGKSVPIALISLSAGVYFAHKQMLTVPVADVRHHKTAMVVGAGPAGMMAAETLLRQGWEQVTVVDRNSEILGMFRDGIPNWKTWQPLVRSIIDAYHAIPPDRLEFGLNRTVTPDDIAAYAIQYDLVVVAHGARVARPFELPSGRRVIQALEDVLAPQNEVNFGASGAHPIGFQGKKVALIGLGYTGIDFLNTANYNGAEVHVISERNEADVRTDTYAWREIESARNRGVIFHFGLARAISEETLAAIDQLLDRLNPDIVGAAKGFDIQDISHTKANNVIYVGDGNRKLERRLVVEACADALVQTRAAIERLTGIAINPHPLGCGQRTLRQGGLNLLGG